eukprot:10848263-Heterocapsa_arctica.AAC.1
MSEVPQDFYQKVMKWTPWVTEGRARGKAPRAEQVEGGVAPELPAAPGGPAIGEEDPGPLGARNPTLPARSALGWVSTKLNNLRAFWDACGQTPG